MANVLNRTTKEYQISVNTPDYDPSEWIINPDLSAVEDVPSEYWVVTGDTVTPDRLQWRKDLLKQEVDLIRDTLLYGGFKWNGYTFASGPDDIANITATVTSVAAGVPLPVGFGWRTVNRETIPMDEYQVVDFGATAMDRYQVIYAVSWYHKDQIDSLPAEQYVLNYPIHLGWPPAIN